MSGKTLFGDTGHLEIFNPAQVPQYSPLRYPGGKSRWYPFVKRWLLPKPDNVTLIEPFAGGCSMGLAAGIEELVGKVILVEKNEDVAAFWKTVFEKPDWLVQRIQDFEVTRENVKELLSQKENNVYQRGFLLFLHNRTSRGGITADGAGLLKEGEKGKGIKSRWYPETLVQRIKAISEKSDNFEFIKGDGVEVMEKHLDKNDASFFVDPPYTVAGERLYDDSEVNHERLFDLLSQVEGDFLATYDDAKQIRKLAEKHEFQTEEILMSTTHHEKKFELFISEEFSWLSNGGRVE
jgi:DNA adenine methylase